MGWGTTMAWWSISTPNPASARPTSAEAAATRGGGARGGLGLIEQRFPGSTPVQAAVAELLGQDVVLLRLLEALRPGGWTAQRASIQALREAGGVAAAGAPVTACFALVAWDGVTDGHGAYGLFDALSLLAHQTLALRALVDASGDPSSPAAVLLRFVQGPALDALVDRARGPLVAGHRGLVAFLQTTAPEDARATAGLLAIADLPIPVDDAGWHEHTRAEALRALASRAAAVRAAAAAAPRPWPVASSPPQPDGAAGASALGAGAPVRTEASGEPEDRQQRDPSAPQGAPSQAVEAHGAEGADPALPRPTPTGHGKAMLLAAPPPEAELLDAASGLLSVLVRELESGVVERVRVAFGLLPGVSGGDQALDDRLPALIDWCADRSDPAITALRSQALQRWAQRARTPGSAGHAPHAAGGPVSSPSPTRRPAAPRPDLRADARADLLSLATGSPPAEGPEGLMLRVQALDLLTKGLPEGAEALLVAARSALAAPEPALQRAGARALAAIAARG